VRFYVPQASLAGLPIGAEVDIHCDGCAAHLAARVAFVSPTAEFTPPVIYSNESRQKLVFLVEARPLGDTATLLKPGQPIDVVPRRPA
jgi:HlyD family secretion protein